MKKIFNFILLCVVLFSGCQPVKPILFLKSQDLFWVPFVYLLLSFAMAKALSINQNGKFWLWFILCMILTPFAGMIVILYKLNK